MGETRAVLKLRKEGKIGQSHYTSIGYSQYNNLYIRYITFLTLHILYAWRLVLNNHMNIGRDYFFNSSNALESSISSNTGLVYRPKFSGLQMTKFGPVWTKLCMGCFNRVKVG